MMDAIELAPTTMQSASAKKIFDCRNRSDNESISERYIILYRSTPRDFHRSH